MAPRYSRIYQMAVNISIPVKEALQKAVAKAFDFTLVKQAASVIKQFCKAGLLQLILYIGQLVSKIIPAWIIL